jgi:DNA-binding MarR family transcriptional regulator
VTELPIRSQPRRQWPGRDHLGALLRDPTLAMNELVSEALAEQGFADFRPALGTIGQHIADQGSRVTELATLAQISSPTATYLVNELERGGYVERVPDPSDGRARLVRLTGRGRRAQQRGREAIARIETDWAAAMGDREFAELRRLLGRLHATLWPPSAGE